jgi:hypothetical protein
MRAEHLDVSTEQKARKYNAYGVEVRLLTAFSNMRHVVDMLDCGFLSDRRCAPAEGEIVSFGTDAQAFNDHLTEFMQKGWRPYLSEILMPERYNLYLLLTERGNPQRRLPIEEGLDLCLQYGELMERVHEHDVIYSDYKTAHFYWDGARLCVIDWNNSKVLNGNGFHPSEVAHHKQTDIRNFILGIMYPVFTGLSPLVDAALPSGPADFDAAFNRYEKVQLLDFGIQSTLAPCLMDMMMAGVQGEYKEIAQFMSDLQSCARYYGWTTEDRQGQQTAAVYARERLRAGIQALRRAQNDLLEAQRCFTEALEFRCDDLESQRLLKATEDFIAKRVIP